MKREAGDQKGSEAVLFSDRDTRNRVTLRNRAVKEELLARVWRSKMLRGRELVTTGGQRLRIIHRGWANGGSGPDFHHAIIALKENGLLKGDVEIHVSSSQWRSHGHHRDPGYNGVILHVVMWDNQNYHCIS